MQKILTQYKSQPINNTFIHDKFIHDKNNYNLQLNHLAIPI